MPEKKLTTVLEFAAEFQGLAEILDNLAADAINADLDTLSFADIRIFHHLASALRENASRKLHEELMIKKLKDKTDDRPF